MEPLILTDKTITPNDELVFSIIGENRVHWQKLISIVKAKYPDAQEQWNYYNDGKCWLFRMIRKKKTLFWIGILEGTFRITFYFGDKAEPIIEMSDLPDNMKEDFKNGKRFGKIRAISMRVQHAENIENAIKLVNIRTKV
jgi:hypothetical protein